MAWKSMPWPFTTLCQPKPISAISSIRMILLMMVTVCLNACFLVEQPFSSFFEYYPRFRDFIRMLQEQGGKGSAPRPNWLFESKWHSKSQHWGSPYKVPGVDVSIPGFWKTPCIITIGWGNCSKNSESLFVVGQSYSRLCLWEANMWCPRIVYFFGVVFHSSLVT